MMDDDTFPDLDPRPDEDAWEAYLTFAHQILGGAEENGLDNEHIAALETALGVQLPYEVGLLLVMGVPADSNWVDWRDDPAQQLAEWRESIAGLLELDPSAVDAAPPLLPLAASFAVPLTPAIDHESNDSNPILRIDETGTSVAGLDLADWLHKEFDVPLPWWPENTKRRIHFWSELSPR